MTKAPFRQHYGPRYCKYCGIEVDASYTCESCKEKKAKAKKEANATLS